MSPPPVHVVPFDGPTCRTSILASSGDEQGRTVSRGRPKIRCVRLGESDPGSLLDRLLPPDDVVDLEHLGLARKLDPDVLQHRHETLAERVELLSRVPDLADSEVTVRLEGDVVLKSLRQPVARLLQTADGFVVLVG